MRQRRVILVTLLAFLFCVGGYVLLRPSDAPVCNFRASREPVYKGKPYSFWVEQDQFIAAGKGLVMWRREDNLYDATRAIGTNAIPHLLRWIAYEPAPWAEKARYHYNRFKAQSARPGVPATNLWINKKIVRAARAPDAFRMLGQKAEPAIPELARLATSTKSNVATRAMTALTCLGSNALPPVIALITNRAPRCEHLIWEMRQFGVMARPAIPVLIDCLSDRKESVANRAAGTLGTLQLEEDRVLPALIGALGHPSPRTRIKIMEVLCWYGPRGKPAAAKLREIAANDPDQSVRLAASNTLWQLGFGKTTDTARKNLDGIGQSK